MESRGRINNRNVWRSPCSSTDNTWFAQQYCAILIERLCKDEKGFPVLIRARFFSVNHLTAEAGECRIKVHEITPCSLY
jgi:hypothetical protein